MLTSLVKLEVKIEEKVYQFLCDHDSPIACVKEAIFQLTKEVAEVEARILASQKEKEKESEQIVQEINEQ